MPNRDIIFGNFGPKKQYEILWDEEDFEEEQQ